jgi:potassium voltage-gated channel Eag-related subfamily H protein 8
MANKFNEYFATAGHDVANSIPPSSKDPLDYLQNNNAHDFHFGNTSQAEIVNTIRDFQNKKSTDIDGLSMCLLRSVAMEISSPLAHIFNLSLRSGRFPSALKNSRVVPIFKAGEQDRCSNYRPISLLSSISKILEKIVHKRLVAHLEYHKLLSPFQFGFQAGRNTEQNLIQVVNQITEHLNGGGSLTLKKPLMFAPMRSF